MKQENSDFFTFFVVVVGDGDVGVTHTCVIAQMDRWRSEFSFERLRSLPPCGSQELSLGLDL